MLNNTDTCQSGLPIPLFTFCSKLTESVRADGMGVLSPLEVIQQTSCVTDYTSVVKLEPSVYTVRSCGLPFSWIKSLIFESISPAGHSLISPAGHSQQCLPKFFGRNVSSRCWNWFGYLSHSLFCLSSVSWHTCSIESSACPIPVCTLLCFSWLHSGLGGIFNST